MARGDVAQDSHQDSRCRKRGCRRAHTSNGRRGTDHRNRRPFNHYGLDLTTPDAQNFLFDNIKGFLFGEIPQIAEAEIDTSKEGTVKW